MDEQRDGESAPPDTWTDELLVDACLRGHEDAWAALVDRYQYLVFGIARRYGANSEQASDLFQGIWLDAYNDLPTLRKKGSLRSWLISLATHKCYHWKHGRHQRMARESIEVNDEILAEQGGTPPDFIGELERKQLVRDALRELPERCKELIKLLFYRFPPIPYRDLAKRLGLATGSIGFIRGRCLKKLKQALEEKGL